MTSHMLMRISGWNTFFALLALTQLFGEKKILKFTFTTVTTLGESIVVVLYVAAYIFLFIYSASHIIYYKHITVHKDGTITQRNEDL